MSKFSEIMFKKMGVDYTKLVNVQKLINIHLIIIVTTVETI